MWGRVVMKTLKIYAAGLKGRNLIDHIAREKYDDINIMVYASKEYNVLHDYCDEIKSIVLSANNMTMLTSNLELCADNTIEVAVGWKKIIDSSSELFVLHDSLLPKYRGFAPLVNMLKNGETIIGSTLIKANDKYDEGDILFQEAAEIDYPIKLIDAIEIVSVLNNVIFDRFMDCVRNEYSFPCKKQEEEHATYSVWLDYDDYKIDWACSSKYIKRFIDSVGYPYLGAKSKYKERTITVHEAVIHEDVCIENRTIGKIFRIENACPVVICGHGLLTIIDATYDDTGSSILEDIKLKGRLK